MESTTRQQPEPLYAEAPMRAGNFLNIERTFLQRTVTSRGNVRVPRAAPCGGTRFLADAQGFASAGGWSTGVLSGYSAVAVSVCATSGGDDLLQGLLHQACALICLRFLSPIDDL